MTVALPPLNLSAGGGGPSSTKSDPFFGSLLGSLDTSNWAVNFADFGTATTKQGDKTGPTLTPSNTQNTIPPNTPTPYFQNNGGGGGISTVAIIAGGVALVGVLGLVLWARR